MKKVIEIRNAPKGHWVGDGFPVHSMFTYNDPADSVSPFLLLDYAGPAQFDRAEKPRGVGEHPHRGFETVTIVYDGEVAHRDSSGEGGIIGAGDVQWMTAGSGILHEEFHSEEFTRSGGKLEMVQLWVNLPSVHKMTKPKYQSLPSRDIPEVTLPGNTGTLRVIAGNHNDVKGPARTFTPMAVFDIRLNSGGSRISLPDGWNTMLLVLKGQIRINGTRDANESQLVVFDRTGEYLDIEAGEDANLLLLSGEPIDEPIVGYGPFVMNSRDEIDRALADYRSGNFGRLPADS